MARVLSLSAAAVFLLPSVAQARKVHWQHAGASIYGGACEYGHIGYRGDDLRVAWKSFAELGMGSALGGLPYLAKIRVLNPRNHRRMTIRKRDLGGGGANVFGLHRSIDLWQPVAARVFGASCSWTGAILYRRV